MFSLLLQNCTKLRTLVIASEETDFVRDCDKNEGHKLTLSKIEELFVNVSNPHLSIPPNLVDVWYLPLLILNLPNLQFIRFCTDLKRDSSMQIYHVIMEHLKKYNGQLKVIFYLLMAA